MDATTTNSMGVSDVLRIVEGWPSSQKLELTRHLAGSLAPAERESIAREILPGASDTELPPQDLSKLLGIVPLPAGWPEDITAEEIRERRLAEKYGS